MHKGGCIYNKHRYDEEENVRTEQPCLKCICRKGVVLCTMRVCPPVKPMTDIETDTSKCHIVRQEGTCCPTVDCITDQKLKQDDNKEMVQTNLTTNTPLIALDGPLFKQTIDHDDNNTITNRININHMVSVILQTIPSSSFPDKQYPLAESRIDSRPASEPHLTDLLGAFGKHCLINSTFYAEGSPIISSSFCEYCYCIRGKRMCIRPRCHLSILGCLPKYSNEYACCPTSYACGEDALTTSSNQTENHVEQDWSFFYSLDEKLINHHQQQNNNGTSLKDEESTTTTSTTIVKVNNRLLTTTMATISRSSSRMTDCVFDDVAYSTGDAMPSDGNCSQCYCSGNGTRVCGRIKCSLNGAHHCTPIIPDGHCCPIEYKCDSEKIFKNEFDEIAQSVDQATINVVEQTMPVTTMSSSLETNSTVTDTSSSNDVEFTTQPLGMQQENVLFNVLINETDNNIDQRLINDTKLNDTLQLVTSEGRSNDLEMVNFSKSANDEVNNIFNLLATKFGNYLRKQTIDKRQGMLSEMNLVSSSMSPSNQMAISNDGNDQSPVETMKSMRNWSLVPTNFPNNNSNKNVMFKKINPNNKIHTFSNGWRAIPALKSKPKPVHLVPADQRPMVKEKKKDETTQTSSTAVNNLINVNTSPMASTIKPETNSISSNNVEATSSNHVINNQTDISKAKCIVDGKEYENGDTIIPKSADPCTYCRCFYGKEICHEQKCPSPPSNDCLPERTSKQCCPLYTCKQLTESNTKTTEPINSYRNVSTNGPETFSTEKSILARRGPQHQPNDSSPESNKTQSNNIESLSKNFENEPADSHQHQHHHQQRIPFPMDTLPRPLDMVYGARLDNRIHFPPNHRPNLPPGLIVPPGLQGSILNLNNPFIKRPIFGPNAFGQPIKIDDLRGLGPIRPIPQSPIQNQKTKAPDEIGSRCNIYGKIYQTGEEVEQLSNECKRCICSSHGVQCRVIC
ncbi:hypothetical protein RDWZM_007289 [Blomia tropicalis]|uniref:VWFC domain-containing protein n=1 Tax=Blomia tropicalis TaxID=40697 RepID=A0A9Q0M1E4_BLOTA|nr:hypothetical protein RDWZM_007289 [Blomia tropicalis]